MPDGSIPPRSSRLPATLVDQARVALRVPADHRWVTACVAWMMFRRNERGVDLVEVANHYALWCFDKAYYEAFSRMRD